MISIIIVNFNGKSHLEKCLNSLNEVDYKNFEIILVDNNSDDDSIKFVVDNFPSVILIKLDKNYGFARPSNIGAKNAKGEYLLFLNNDTVVKSNFLSELISVAKKDSKIAICQSLLLKPNEEIDSSGDFIDELGIAFSSKKKIEQVNEILSAKGAAMLVNKEIFNKLGGFDEKFVLTFEDVDLGWRAWIMGYKVVVAPNSIVYHTGSQTIEKMKQLISFHGFKNQISMKITNFETKNAIKSIILFFLIYGIRELKILFDYKIKGVTKMTGTEYEKKIAEKPNLRIILKSIIWNFRNLRYLINKHKKVNSSRLISTAELQKKRVILSR